MKLGAYFSRPMTGDVYRRVGVQNPNTGQTIYTFVFDHTITFRGGTDNTSRLLAYTTAPETKGYEMRNIKDALGNLLYPDARYTVSLVDPMVNLFGIREGYRMKLLKVDF